MHVVLVHRGVPSIWLPACHLISVAAGVGIVLFCITGRSNRTLVLMRNSSSSNSAHFGPSFAVSHSPFSSPPSWETPAATSFEGSHLVAASASACFQLACLFLSGLGSLLLSAIALSSIESPECLNLVWAFLAAPTSPESPSRALLWFSPRLGR